MTAKSYKWPIATPTPTSATTISDNLVLIERTTHDLLK